MPRPILASIFPHAVAHNLAQVRAQVGAYARHNAGPCIWAVIKANGYGHGIRHIYPGLESADGLAMLDLDEAAQCRDLGWPKPILMLEGFFDPEDLRAFRQYRLAAMVHHPDQLAMLERDNCVRDLDIHLKLNSGMNRLGFAPDQYAQAFARALQLQKRGVVGNIGHVMHFANGDQPATVERAMALFSSSTAGMPGPRSVCNSAATLGSPQLAAATDWIRPGICLYGATPFDQDNVHEPHVAITRAAVHPLTGPTPQPPRFVQRSAVSSDNNGVSAGQPIRAGKSAADLGLRPAMALRSRIIAEQQLEIGAAVGYGGTFVADQRMRIGIVACGYADGYPRHAPTGTPVVVAGVRTRLVGRVSMDMLAVDLTPAPNAVTGSPVALWGADGLSVDEVAAAAGTIGYELLTAVTARVPKRVSACADA